MDRIQRMESANEQPPRIRCDPPNHDGKQFTLSSLDEGRRLTSARSSGKRARTRERTRWLRDCFSREKENHGLGSRRTQFAASNTLAWTSNHLTRARRTKTLTNGLTQRIGRHVERDSRRDWLNKPTRPDPSRSQREAQSSKPTLRLR